MRFPSGAQWIVALLVVGLAGLIGAGVGALVEVVPQREPDRGAADVAAAVGRGGAGGALLALAGTAWWLLERARRPRPPRQ